VKARERSASGEARADLARTGDHAQPGALVSRSGDYGCLSVPHHSRCRVELQELESDDLLEASKKRCVSGGLAMLCNFKWLGTFRIFAQDLLANRNRTGTMLPIDGPLDLSRARQLASIDRADLKDAPFTPYTPPELGPKRGRCFHNGSGAATLFFTIYESFQPDDRVSPAKPRMIPMFSPSDDSVPFGRNSRCRSCCTRIENGSRSQC